MNEQKNETKTQSDTKNSLIKTKIQTTLIQESDTKIAQIQRVFATYNTKLDITNLVAINTSDSETFLNLPA